ncbi:unannotated protein [freshwater metagenome]|uniref:Unannotated protein n=1 Tax=freshwater metagenome TaxID=449393 RepID=A0A6J7I1L8_9ZZZZ
MKTDRYPQNRNIIFASSAVHVADFPRPTTNPSIHLTVSTGVSCAR